MSPTVRAQPISCQRVSDGAGTYPTGIVFPGADAETLRAAGIGEQVTTPYHVLLNPPRVPGICDTDGMPLVQRDDDREETIRRRVKVYRKNTADLLTYYRERGLLREVPAAGDIEDIYHRLLQAAAGIPA